MPWNVTRKNVHAIIFVRFVELGFLMTLMHSCRKHQLQHLYLKLFVRHREFSLRLFLLPKFLNIRKQCEVYSSLNDQHSVNNTKTSAEKAIALLKALYCFNIFLVSCYVLRMLLLVMKCLSLGMNVMYLNIHLSSSPFCVAIFFRSLSDMVPQEECVKH